MSNASLLYPVFVQVALTFVLMFAMGRARVGAIRRREVKVRDIALGQADPWPERPKAIARSFHNQFEMPLLFYVLVGLVLATRSVTTTLVALAWAYVLLRLVHAAIHVGSNNINQRFGVFILSSLVLAAMWVMFGWTIVALG